MNPAQIALNILNDPDPDRRTRRLLALLERRKHPRHDPIAIAILKAGDKLGRRANEWYAVLAETVFGYPPETLDKSFHSFMGRLVADDSGDPIPPELEAVLAELDVDQPGIPL